MGARVPSISARAYDESREDEDRYEDEDGRELVGDVSGAIALIEEMADQHPELKNAAAQLIKALKEFSSSNAPAVKSKALLRLDDALKNFQLARLAHDKESWLQVVQKSARPQAGPARTRRHENLEAVAADADLWRSIVKRR